MTTYCTSRFSSIRRQTREVRVGSVGVGASNPIRIQSMTTTLTTDVEATVRQTRALVEAGCEIVRITAPNVKSAKALGLISRQLKKDRVDVPLVADIHFLPSAAMEAVEHVDKVRINPGNYADKKKFQVREYSDLEYNLEIERLHEAFSPLVLRCKELGKSMRIGTNHGSLSDRIMNRFGDSPLGMVESALEFIRIAESHGFKDIILSMKASNPKVMIQAYRLVVAKMREEGMEYPLHLGVTEAGDGEDGRIKSAIGIGSLLMDGLGDTIRVSLTEDPVYEIPVALELAEKTGLLWKNPGQVQFPAEEGFDPYSFVRRHIESTKVSKHESISAATPPRVFIKPGGENSPRESMRALIALTSKLNNEDTPLEGWIVGLPSPKTLEDLIEVCETQGSIQAPLILEMGKSITPGPQLDHLLDLGIDFLSSVQWENSTRETFKTWCQYCRERSLTLLLGISAKELANNSALFLSTDLPDMILFPSHKEGASHPVGQYRLLLSVLKSLNWHPPIWIRSRKTDFISSKPGFLNDLLETSLLAGSLLTDGFGDIFSVESVNDAKKGLSLAYNVLQGAGARISRTEYVACPSCGRTLFDLQSTTRKIRQATDHLKGVKIAVMGCIVNGPGEMADADFGYVGGAPGKVNLYIGKACVEYHVPENRAVDRLIELIKTEGKWVETKQAVILEN